MPLDDGPPDDGVVSSAGGRRRTYSRDELAQAAGLEPGQVAELESFGLVSPAREESGEPRFDDDALEVAKVAAGFFAARRRGPPPAHVPHVRRAGSRCCSGRSCCRTRRQRNPDARARLQEELVELATLGRRLRTALLRDARRDRPWPSDARAAADPARRATTCAECVRRLGAEIAPDHPDGVVLVGVLKGALIFTRRSRPGDPGDRRDRRLHRDLPVRARFGPGAHPPRPRPSTSSGRDVVIVEDIVDTGLTLAYLLEHIRARAPGPLDVCTLLDRPARRIVPLPVRYVGVEIPDVFVLGYGLHVADLYRNLPCVVEADRAVLADDPDAYVAQLYGR